MRIRSLRDRESASAPRNLRGFTLIELLVVVAIIALLIAILLPSLRGARMQARMVVAHSDLQQIRLATDMYLMDNSDHLPPIRCGCSLRAAYEPPPELATGGYLPSEVERTAGGDVTHVAMQDPFTRTHYRFRAVGAMMMNDVTLLEPPSGSKLYVPDGYPYHLEEPGRYIRDPDESPIRYAIWSVGPDPEAEKLSQNFGRAPTLKRFWMMRSSDVGIITHIINRNTPEVRSP
jgi:prepilin-type N-terminal cleavage/methylation domain-containing protein